MEIKAIIIDDEADARENLRLLFGRFCRNINLKGEFANLKEGVEYLKNNKTDLVFLDVEMPEYAGYEIGHFFDTIDFDIIFITAYDKFAIKAFELAAIDYLLKPIDIERLQEAIKRFEEKQELMHTQQRLQKMNRALNSNRKPTISVHHQGYKKLLEIDTILAVEGQSAYSEIYTTDGKRYILSKNMAEVEKDLKGFTLFYRCHKSWIVNLKQVTDYSKSNFSAKLSNGMEIKISRLKLKEFAALLNQ